MKTKYCSKCGSKIIWTKKDAAEEVNWVLEDGEDFRKLKPDEITASAFSVFLREEGRIMVEVNGVLNRLGAHDDNLQKLHDARRRK